MFWNLQGQQTAFLWTDLINESDYDCDSEQGFNSTCFSCVLGGSTPWRRPLFYSICSVQKKKQRCSNSSLKNDSAARCYIWTHTVILDTLAEVEGSKRSAALWEEEEEEEEVREYQTYQGNRSSLDGYRTSASSKPSFLAFFKDRPNNLFMYFFLNCFAIFWCLFFWVSTGLWNHTVGSSSRLQIPSFYTWQTLLKTWHDPVQEHNLQTFVSIVTFTSSQNKGGRGLVVTVL